MTCYVVAILKVSDSEAYARYGQAFRAMFEGFDGKVIAADNAPVHLEGQADFNRVAMIAFRDRAEAERWYRSPEYQAAMRDHRWKASVGDVMFVEGLPET